MKSFRAFSESRNILGVGIGVALGASFAKIVESMVRDIIMPPLGLIFGTVDLSNIFFTIYPGNDGKMIYKTLADAQSAHAITMNVGSFLNTIISFTLAAIAVFLVIRWLSRTNIMIDSTASRTKSCPFCLSDIPYRATKCKFCTSTQPELKPSKQKREKSIDEKLVHEIKRSVKKIKKHI